MTRRDSRHVVVIGAGAAGLAATAALRAAGVDTLCLEARDRVGGRLLSVSTAGGALDLGATWFWDGEDRVAALAAQAGVGTFGQHLAGDTVVQDPAGARRLPGNLIDVPAHRFAAGAQQLATALAEALPAGALRLGTPVTALHPGSGGGLEVRTPGGTLHAGRAVLAVPPALALERIDFGGALPDDVASLARSTPVWMGAVIKVVAQYRSPFWREAGLAGAAFSRTGPLQEIHDMSGPGGSPAALFGFANALAAGPGFAEATIAQLQECFGPAAAAPEALHVQDWSREEWTAPSSVHRLTDYGLFGHPLYQQPALDGRLHWASTETEIDHAGHIEGALAAGQRAAHAVLAGLPPRGPAPGPADLDRSRRREPT